MMPPHLAANPRPLQTIPTPTTSLVATVAVAATIPIISFLITGHPFSTIVSALNDLMGSLGLVILALLIFYIGLKAGRSMPMLGVNMVLGVILLLSGAAVASELAHTYKAPGPWEKELIQWLRGSLTWAVLVSSAPFVGKRIELYRQHAKGAHTRYSMAMHAEALEDLVEERTRAYRELVGKMAAAEQETRKQISHDVHDTFTQDAAGALKLLETLRRVWLKELNYYASQGLPITPEMVKRFEEDLVLPIRTVKECVTASRSLINDLRPTILDDFGLAAAIRAKVDAMKHEGLDVSLEISEPLTDYRQRVLPQSETALYRICQEATQNIKKHAGATHIAITLTINGVENDAPEAKLTIRDNGHGFDSSKLNTQKGGPGERIGLASMRERVNLLGGRFCIESDVGFGTTVTAEIPMSEGGGSVTPDKSRVTTTA